MIKKPYNLSEQFQEETLIASNRPGKIYTLFFLSLLVLAIFWLPELIVDPAEENSLQTLESYNSVEKTLDANRKASQADLRKTFMSINDLKELNPNVWVKSEWKEIQEILERGQLNYRTKRYESASKDFIIARKHADELVEKAPVFIESLVSVGNLALQTDDSSGAQQAFKKILRIQPNHLVAERGLNRALNLDKVSSLISQGNSFEEMDSFDAAKDAFLEALRIDPESTAANAAIQRLEIPEKEKKFYTLMSQGYRRLNENSFTEAKKSFLTAFKVFGNRQGPMEAIDEVNNARINYNIAEMDKKALNSKKNERWADAHHYLSEILKLDSSLSRAKKQRNFALRRMRLEKQILKFTNEPLLLSKSKNFETAQAVLSSAKREAFIGPNLDVQIKKLEEALIRSREQINVIIKSDNVTKVRLGKDVLLGIFTEKVLQLIPGEYTLYGSRKDCEEISKSFEIHHEEKKKNIEIICPDKTR